MFSVTGVIITYALYKYRPDNKVRFYNVIAVILPAVTVTVFPTIGF